MPLTEMNNSAMTRAEVMAVQERLLLHGIDPGPVDGILGRRTAAAVTAFKRRIGMVARPWVGPLTWAALMEEPQVNESADENTPWIFEGLRIKGWHEREDNSALRQWLRSDGHTLGDPATYPWCGDFVETCIRLALPQEPFPGALGINPYWALNWRSFGLGCQPCHGAIVSITRTGGGHVGFAMGQDATRIFVLGGNQSDRVSIVPIARARFDAASWRWPSTYAGPQRMLPQMTSAEASAIHFS
jgi:uncharacterized protein (TIGR02594 family)